MTTLPNDLTSTSTLLVGQSGGATVVINSSLAGVVDAGRASGAFDRVLGLRNGIEGLFQERFIDLTRQTQNLIDRVRRTPSAALGTGRYKLREDDLDRAVLAMQRLGVGAFVYIGGNDSADTAHRLEQHARAIGYDLRVMSVPKTIDNDLPETDHCPGYPSIARFLGNAVRDATYDSIASPQLYPVKFVEVMGRDAGWVAAAGALGFTSEESDLAPLVLLPERAPQSVDDVLAAIEVDVKRRGFSIVVVPETMSTATGQHLGGDEPEYVDGFGHPYFPSTGAAMTRLVSQKLHLRGRYDKPGTAARMSIALASEVDLEEAYALGTEAVKRIVDGESGFMTAISRTSDDPYTYDVVNVPLEKIANRVRHLDEAFIGADGMSVTSAFHDYMRPLLGENPFPLYGRFA